MECAGLSHRTVSIHVKSPKESSLWSTSSQQQWQLAVPRKAELQTITPLKDVELQSTSMSFKPLPRLPCYTTPLRKPNKVPPCKCASVSLTAIGTDCKLLEFFEDGLFKGPPGGGPQGSPSSQEIER